MRTTLLALANFIWASTGLSAAMISYSASFPTATTDYTSSVSLQKFNPMLGTLNSVDVFLSGTSQGSATITNSNSTSRSVIFLLASQITLTDPLTNVLAQISPFFSSNVNIAGNSSTMVSGSGSDSVTNSYTDPVILTEFTGANQMTMQLVSLQVEADNSSGFDGSMGITFSSTTSAGGGVTVTYNYSTTPVNPVPEPATMGLFSSALSGVGVAIVRRKRKISR